MPLLEELKRARSVRQLSEPHLNDLAGLASLRECPEGTVLFQEGQGSPFLYCVLQGEVSLQVQEPFGETVEIDTVGAGDLLGWSAVFGRPSLTATARTATPCRLAVFQASRVVGLCEHDPRFGLAFLRQVGLHASERLGSTRRALALARTLTHHSPYALGQEGSD
jgi:CRP-like cAMP-binding protein